MAKKPTKKPAPAAPAAPNIPHEELNALPAADVLPTEVVLLSSLKPHPRNYREHPEDQIEHLMQSIRANGFYRNIVVARDGTILAGHGVSIAAARMKLATVPVVRLPVDPDSSAALKVVAGDNEIARLAMIDDRALTEMLREIRDGDEDGLIGTGFDEKSLAALLFVTRPASEIADAAEAGHWLGMPEFGVKEEEPKVTLTFRSKEDRVAWVAKQKEAGFDYQMHYKAESSWSTWWPSKDRSDLASVKFVEGAAAS